MSVGQFVGRGLAENGVFKDLEESLTLRFKLKRSLKCFGSLRSRRVQVEGFLIVWLRLCS